MRKPWYTHLYVRSPVAKILLGILAVGGGIVLLGLIGLLELPRMEAQTNSWEGRGVEKGALLYASNCSSCHGIDGRGGAGPALNSHYFFTQRLNDVGFTGRQYDYVALTVAAGRPSKVSTQWSVVMPTWSVDYGGPLRNDQVENLSHYVMNWESAALAQSAEEDPWIPFEDAPSKASPEDLAAGGADTGDTGGPRPPEELFVSMGCAGCHNLDEPQTDDNRGPVAPNMGNLIDHGSQRVDGQTAEEYVYNSIVNPNSFVVESYLANVMPQNLSVLMTEEEIQGLVAWLLDPSR